MKSIIDSNKRRCLAFARATARRARITIPTEADLKEDSGLYYIDLSLPTKAKLPVGLTKCLKTSTQKTAIISDAKSKIQAEIIK